MAAGFVFSKVKSRGQESLEQRGVSDYEFIKNEEDRHESWISERMRIL